MTIIIFILILALLVLVHELGHFIAAKKNGVAVEEFGIGFPPRIFSLKYKETVYSINAVPLGGFVKLYGEEYAEVNSKVKRQNSKSKTFIYKKPWQKAMIIASGVVGNFLLGWVLISFLFTQGVPTPINKVVVEKVQAGSPAAMVGLKEKDTITSLIPPTSEGGPISLTSSTDLITLSKKFAGRPVALEILRDGKKLTVKLTPRVKPPPGQGHLGIVITSFVEKKYPWYQAPFFGLVEAAKITQRIVAELIKTLVQLAALQHPTASVAGPIGIARYTAQAVKFGKNAVLEFIALLSLNLAVINIFPFPALDGGRLVFVIYEGLTKKRVNPKLERYLNLVGIFILLTLAVVISVDDLARIIR